MMRWIAGLGLLLLAAAPSNAAREHHVAAHVTDTSWTVTYDGQKLMEYVFGPDQAKPYVRELAPLGGTNLLRDSPADHKHHHALMYGIRVDDANFWEETPGHGVQKPVIGSEKTRGEERADGGCTEIFEQTIHWVTEANASRTETASVALLIEHRTLTLSVDPATKEVALRWRGDFEVGPKAREVTLSGANYHGLGMRFLQELDPAAWHLVDGASPDLSGTKQDLRPGAYGAVSFVDVPAHRATVAVFGSPRNAGGNHYFSMQRPFPYLSVTQGLDAKPLAYRARDRFAVEYLVTVHPTIQDGESLRRRAEAWARDVSGSR